MSLGCITNTCGMEEPNAQRDQDRTMSLGTSKDLALSLEISAQGIRKALRKAATRKLNAARRERYATDPEYRKRVAANTAKYLQKKKEALGTQPRRVGIDREKQKARWAQRNEQRRTGGKPGRPQKYQFDLRSSEGKRLARIMALPGYKACKHDAHVDAMREHSQAKASANRQLHDAHVKEFKSNDARVMRWRTAHDAAFRANQRMRVAIRKAMKQRKAGRAWESLVGYTLNELLSHLQKALPKRVSLQDALEKGWHIDHIVPKSSFDLSSDDGVRCAWALPNLRLVPAKVNLTKNAKRIFLI